MRKAIFSALLTVLGSSFCHAQMPDNDHLLSAQKPSSGKLEVINDFPSKLIRQRDVAIWTPEGYEKGQPVDVLYMHDGQQVFDSSNTWNHQEWEIDEHITKLMKEKKIRPTIVVAIANISEVRLTDYFPQRAVTYLGKDDRANIDYTELKADAYLRFIVEELKPYVDEQYQPLTSAEHTYIMGSSMGGLISLYAVCEYPHIFGGAGCLSTHTPLVISDKLAVPEIVDRWAGAFRRYVADRLQKPNTHLIYMDRGNVELDGLYEPYQTALDKQFTEMGWDKQHFSTHVYDGHRHMESDWARRIDTPLMFLLGTNR